MSMQLRIWRTAAWIAPLCGLLLGATGRAQEWQWAQEMFDHTSYDFGVIARGAKAEHVFTMENKYEEDVHIATVRSGCPCTTAQVSKDYLKTWEQAKITAIVDTRAAPGRKDATLTVKLDKPFPKEVQLHVHSFIRGDVVVQPGAVQFGSVAQGTGARQKVAVSYAGRVDWQILKVESANPNLSGQVTETARGPDRVSYDLWVALKGDAPAGYIQENVVLVTNDYNAQSARVPVPVEGIVVPGLTVRPSPLMLGLVTVNQAVTRQLVVQGKAPFRVVGASCSDPHFKFNVPATASTTHLIPVTFTADAAPGKMSGMIHIETDQNAGKSLDVPVQVQVVPLEPSAAPEQSGAN